MTSVKRFLPRTLFGRSLLIIVTPLIVLQIVSTWIFYDRHWDTITKRLTTAVAGEIGVLVQLFQWYPDPDDRGQILQTVLSRTEIRAILVPGEILPNTPSPRGGRILDSWLVRSLEERVRRPFRIDTVSSRDRIFIDVQIAEGVLKVEVPRERLFSSTTYVFVLWMVGSSLILFAVASIFMRNQVQPIRRLAEAADAFGKGRETNDFKIVGATEVRLAATAFKRMRDRIVRQIQQRTEMLAGVSHDLRTPLTRMKLALAMLGDRPEVREIEHDVVEMERMLEGYLSFARGEGAEKPAPADLRELIEDVASGSRRQGGRIAVDVPDPIEVSLQRDAFRRCLNNLVSNGMRHAAHVWIGARRTGEMVEIAVDDDGPGIPAEQRKMVFRPFYRIDGSRNPGTGGVGLGLAIARDIVQVHGGEILLRDSPHGGLRVLLRIPL